MHSDVTPPPVPDARDASKVWADVVLPLGLIAGVVVLLSLNITDTGVHEPVETPSGLEAAIRRIVGVLVAGTELAAAVVIGWGVLQAFATYVLKVVRPGGDAVDSTEGLRVRLGRVLALGLEFTLASDILQTAVAPTRADILTLGTVILLRTLLNIFLEREIREIEARRAESERGDEPPPADPDVPMEAAE